MIYDMTNGLHWQASCLFNLAHKLKELKLV